MFRLLKKLHIFHKEHPLMKYIVKENDNGNIALEDDVFVSLGNPSIKCFGSVYICKGTSFHGDGNIEFGNGCFVNNNCWFAASSKNQGGISFGNGCLVGPNCVFVDNDHINNNCQLLDAKYSIKKITIGDNVWIGGGVIILKGTFIGNNSIVGAGSVVKGVFGDNVVIAGNPARVIKKNGNN